MVGDILSRVVNMVFALITLVTVTGFGISIISSIVMIFALLVISPFTLFYDVHNVVNLCVTVLGYDVLIFLSASMLYMIAAVMMEAIN